jgi:hypothetical protein
LCWIKRYTPLTEYWIIGISRLFQNHSLLHLWGIIIIMYFISWTLLLYFRESPASCGKTWTSSYKSLFLYLLLTVLLLSYVS